MALWTDIITPAELTGYARESLADMELQRGTLAKYLPNRHVLDTAVRFVVGGSGLVEEARYRAFDAEPEIGRQQGGKRVSIEMPAVSQKIPVSEYRQLRARNASESFMAARRVRASSFSICGSIASPACRCSSGIRLSSWARRADAIVRPASLARLVSA